MFLLVVYIALAVGVSFLCSVMEAVLLSITPSFIGALADKKPRQAERLKGLKKNIDRPLAAILTLNTVAHTVGAAGAGAQAAVVFADTSVAVFSAVLTLVILILSEIIPKTLGAVYWRGLAGPVAWMMTPLIWITYPLVIVSQGLAKLISRGKKKSPVSREELAALAQIGADEGVFDSQETRMLKNLLNFSQLSAQDVMTPRTVVVAFPADTSIGQVADDANLPFSRLPIYDGDRDNITGYVLRDDVLAAANQSRGKEPLSVLKRDIPTVQGALPLPALFDRLLADRQHIALVLGEYGGTAGLATMEDVIETLLGLEIVDEADTEYDMQAAARDRWQERARRIGVLSEGQIDSVTDADRARERGAAPTDASAE